MVLKGIFVAVLGIGVLAWNGASVADELSCGRIPAARPCPGPCFRQTTRAGGTVRTVAPSKPATDTKAQATPAGSADAVVKVARVHAVKRARSGGEQADAHPSGTPPHQPASTRRHSMRASRSGHADPAAICNWQRH